MKLRLTSLLSVLALSTVVACSSDDSSSASTADTTALQKDIVRTYALHVRANYQEAITKAKALQTAVDSFVESPTAEGLEAAKQAWKDARPSYELSEPYRFYGGPIDAEGTGPEGRINSWPLDEFFVDYVKDQPNAGLINNPDLFPEITKQTIADQNEKGGEKNLSAGYHAIEFLLWGQDLNDAGHEMDPGRRPYTDFVTGAEGTAANQDRRRAYLKAVTDLLVDDLSSVEPQWNLDDSSSYGATMVAGDTKTALANILKGLGSLAGGELSRERMNNAYTTKDQEEEHSCFSDNTAPVDLLYAATGIQNVYLGTYGDDDGPGLDELVAKINPDLDAKVKSQLTATINAIVIPVPFDQAILEVKRQADGRRNGTSHRFARAPGSLNRGCRCSTRHQDQLPVSKAP
ncbi:MAG: imelysin family protein [Polyangiaceae bacterium]